MRTLRPFAAVSCLLLAGILFSTYDATAQGVLGRLFQRDDPALPDQSLTPGDALPVTSSDVCKAGYSSLVRDVPQSLKEQVYTEYGIKHHTKGAYEVDHLVSLELGGSNSIRNLWPQSYRTRPWNAHVKDKLENALHEDVCSGKTDLKTAQDKIAGNWILAYKERFPADPVSHQPARNTRRLGRPTSRNIAPVTRTGVAGAANGQVWVNLNSKIYWRPGTTYYGKTKHGKYLSEADATAAGYRAAKGN